jgi:hypothetical protein
MPGSPLRHSGFTKFGFAVIDRGADRGMEDRLILGHSLEGTDRHYIITAATKYGNIC